jgi:hypothetical protein
VAAVANQNIHSDLSEASDASGIFFQPKQTKYTSNERRQKSEEVGMSLILDEGQSLQLESPPIEQSRVGTGSTTSEGIENSMLLDDGKSLVPDSSPTPATSQPKPNPFVDTPPHRFAVPSSPAKSSPLRQEYRASDTEESYHRDTSIDESTLPVSSPFHTQVDGITNISAASDQKQILREMGGMADSSLIRVRQEADAHAEAYDFRDRTLEDITEATERSKTAQSFAMPSSPPLQFLEEHTQGSHESRLGEARRSMLLNHARALQPEPSLGFLRDHSQTDYGEETRSSSVLDHGDSLTPAQRSSPLLDKAKSSAASRRQTSRPAQRAAKPIIAVAPREEEAAPQPSAGFFSRLTSTIWGSRSDATTSEAPPSSMAQTHTTTPPTSWSSLLGHGSNALKAAETSKAALPTSSNSLLDYGSTAIEPVSATSKLVSLQTLLQKFYHT